MKRYGWQVLLGLLLIILSVFFYLLHYVIFRDPHHIFLFFIGDFAFVFIEVLLVTLIIHRLLSERERRARLEKLNMVIGVFSEVGIDLLSFCSRYDSKLDEIKKYLVDANGGASKKGLDKIVTQLKNHNYNIEIHNKLLEELDSILRGKLDFLLRLLENPALLEHEGFTDLLLAVFHLTEELKARRNFRGLPDADYKHFSGDVGRFYSLLVLEWLSYMKHLKGNYPYLFSLSMRNNPFDPEASPVIK